MGVATHWVYLLGQPLSRNRVFQNFSGEIVPCVEKPYVLANIYHLLCDANCVLIGTTQFIGAHAFIYCAPFSFIERNSHGCQNSMIQIYTTTNIVQNVLFNKTDFALENCRPLCVITLTPTCISACSQNSIEYRES